MPRLLEHQRTKAIVMAQYIDCSPHEWPTSNDIPLLCHALLDALEEVGALRDKLQKSGNPPPDHQPNASGRRKARRERMR